MLLDEAEYRACPSHLLQICRECLHGERVLRQDTPRVIPLLVGVCVGTPQQGWGCRGHTRGLVRYVTAVPSLEGRVFIGLRENVP